MEKETQNLFKKADFAAAIGDYQNAKQMLDEILAQDSENAKAWYEKSKLPVLQEDAVVIQGCNVSVSKYQSLDTTQKARYLQQCGLPYSQALDGDSLLQINILIEKERIKYLEKAVKYTKSEKTKYKKELSKLKAKNSKRGQIENKSVFRISLMDLIRKR